MRIVITRPEPQGQHLCKKIHANGGIAEFFPVIEIIPTPRTSALQTTIAALNTFHMALFVSQPAVQFSLPLIHAKWPLLPAIQFGAIGPATAKALQQFGIENIVLPTEPPYESESLLRNAALQTKAIHGKKIVIFRGNGGRTRLSDTLKKRGARVQHSECYQRCLPQKDPARIEQFWQTKPDAIVTTSGAGIKNLVILLESTERPWLRDTPIVVVGLRMLALANTLGFRHPIVVTGADDDAILAGLTTLDK